MCQRCSPKHQRRFGVVRHRVQVLRWTTFRKFYSEPLTWINYLFTLITAIHVSPFGPWVCSAFAQTDETDMRTGLQAKALAVKGKQEFARSWVLWLTGVSSIAILHILLFNFEMHSTVGEQPTLHAQVNTLVYATHPVNRFNRLIGTPRLYVCAALRWSS